MTIIKKKRFVKPNASLLRMFIIIENEDEAERRKMPTA